MATAAALYSPQVLALATGLAKLPLGPELTLKGEARSPTCGSTIVVGLDLAPDDSIAKIGMSVHACAIGQASAAIFAHGAAGCNRADVAASLAGIQAWLVGEGGMPEWPGLEVIAPARSFAGRHGAILLPWRAALEALSHTPHPR